MERVYPSWLDCLCTFPQAPPVPSPPLPQKGVPRRQNPPPRVTPPSPLIPGRPSGHQRPPSTAASRNGRGACQDNGLGEILRQVRRSMLQTSPRKSPRALPIWLCAAHRSISSRARSPTSSSTLAAWLLRSAPPAWVRSHNNFGDLSKDQICFPFV